MTLDIIGIVGFIPAAAGLCVLAPLPRVVAGLRLYRVTASFLELYSFTRAWRHRDPRAGQFLTPISGASRRTPP